MDLCVTFILQPSSNTLHAQSLSHFLAVIFEVYVLIYGPVAEASNVTEGITNFYNLRFSNNRSLVFTTKLGELLPYYKTNYLLLCNRNMFILYVLHIYSFDSNT